MQNQRNLFIRSARRGLTLIEIMVVIALLGVLGTVIAVNLMTRSTTTLQMRPSSR